jgi:hypothetical protein
MTEKPKRKRQKPGDKNYVNNKEFTKALDDYSRACRSAVESGEEEPVMSRYVGECIMKMAERLATTNRFRNYPYRDEMIGNAIVAAVKYAKNFDGDRFNNGFAYVTQILFSHMVITIVKEKKKYKTNLEMIQQAQLSVFGNSEMTAEAQSHGQMIADQKLKEMQDSKQEKSQGGFRLRTGSTAEQRASYVGTPMNRDEKEEE